MLLLENLGCCGIATPPSHVCPYDGRLRAFSVVVVSYLIFIIKLLQQMITKENMDIFSSSDRVLQENCIIAYMLAIATFH
jgi:hypothetical protein